MRYETSGIALVSQAPITVSGVTLNTAFYRNTRYRCGKQGHFTFLVVELASVTGQKKPLWVLMHGGGVGYYEKGGKYVGGEAANLEEGATELRGVLEQHVGPTGTKKTIATGRLKAGYRFLMPSMCDHDLYGGMGNVYPNNPNGTPPDTVDGLRATMAAIDFTARGSGALKGYPTSQIFLHGTSAGSAGAYIVAHAFERGGVRLNGALLDAYLVSARTEDLFGTGCTPQEKGAVNDGTTFSFKAVIDKIGPFVGDKSLFAERTVGSTGHVPLLDLVGQGDVHCCGQSPVVPAAKAAGATNNCRYVHELLAQAMDKRPASEHLAHLVVDSNAHVLTPSEGTHQTALQAWLDAILATNPPAPWP